MSAVAPLSIVWLQAGGCGGCSMALLGADTRDFTGLLEGAGLALDFHPCLSEASGEEALSLLRDYREGRLTLDILCVEGAIQRGPQGTGAFHRFAGSGEPMADWVRDLAGRANYVMAIGTCTAFGGINAAGENHTEACGLQYEGAEKGGLLGANSLKLTSSLAVFPACRVASS